MAGRLKIINGQYVDVSEYDGRTIAVDASGEIVDTRLRYYSPDEMMRHQDTIRKDRAAQNKKANIIALQRAQDAQDAKLAEIQRTAKYLQAVQLSNYEFNRKQAQRNYLASDLMRPYSMPYEASDYLLTKNTEFTVDNYVDHSDYANAKATEEKLLDVPLQDLATEAEYAAAVGTTVSKPVVSNPFASWIAPRVAQAPQAAAQPQIQIPNMFQSISSQNAPTITFQDIIDAIKVFFQVK
jgi:hypothetical protein